MCIESTNSFEIQCITEGPQIDKAGLSTTIQSQLNKTNNFYVKAGNTLASKLASSTHAHSFGWRKILGLLCLDTEVPIYTLQDV